MKDSPSCIWARYTHRLPWSKEEHQCGPNGLTDCKINENRVNQARSFNQTESMNNEMRITRGWKHVQVGDDNASEGSVEIAKLGEAREIRVAAVVLIGHVHPAVEHYPLPVHRHYHAALPDFLPSAWNRNRKQKVGFKNVIGDRENSSREIVKERGEVGLPRTRHSMAMVGFCLSARTRKNPSNPLWRAFWKLILGLPGWLYGYLNLKSTAWESAEHWF